VQRGKAEAALQSLREIMGKLKLTVDEEKTRICEAPEGEFDLLGYVRANVFSIPSSVLPKLHEAGRAASESLWRSMTANPWGNPPFRGDAAHSQDRRQI
jgi:hypothetical protein